jgi:hypothetical protein
VYPMLPVSLDCFCFVFLCLVYTMLPVSLDCFCFVFHRLVYPMLPEETGNIGVYKQSCTQMWSLKRVDTIGHLIQMILKWRFQVIENEVRIMVFKPLSTIFHLYRGSQFYWWRKLEYLEKTMRMENEHDAPSGRWVWLISVAISDGKLTNPAVLHATLTVKIVW